MSKDTITDKMKIRAIIGYEASQTPEEAQADMDSTTAEDYDAWIRAALNARNESKIQLDGTGKTVEHPTARVLRLGIESIKVGKPSSVFLELLELLAQEAEEHDMLSLCFPDDFAQLPSTAMKTADTYAGISEEFIAFVRANETSGKSFSEIKAQFKREMESGAPPVSSKTVDRALKEHGLNWPARGA